MHERIGLTRGVEFGCCRKVRDVVERGASVGDGTGKRTDHRRRLRAGRTKKGTPAGYLLVGR